MNRSARVVVPLAMFLGVFHFASAARATPADPDLPPDVLPAGGTEPVPGPRRQVAVTLNPLAALVGRFSGNLEYSPHPHHAAMLSIGYVNVTGPMAYDAGPQSGNVRGAIGELGYRYYAFATGADGPSGFYVGPSLTSEALETQAGSLFALGGAVDLGGQLTIERFVIGVGVGVQANVWVSRTFLSADVPTRNFSIPRNASDPLTQQLLYPRLLASVGCAF
jgi:hypothetical protein